MTNILHAEPIERHTTAPLYIGHTDYLFYGHESEKPDDYGEYSNQGTSAASIQIGCPLAMLDQGNTLTQVPLVKTIEYIPDPSRDTGNIYLETLHFRKNKNTLIPYRTKIRNGLDVGTRLIHLPNLNEVRRSLTGFDLSVCDPRSEIVSNLLLYDHDHLTSRNDNLKQWIVDEFIPQLDNRPVNELTFDKTWLESDIRKYTDQIAQTPHEFGISHLRSIANTLTDRYTAIPSYFENHQPFSHSLDDIRARLVTYSAVDFRFAGSLELDRYEGIEYNPPAFSEIYNMLDSIPLTDFFIEIVLSIDASIQSTVERMAIDRVGMFQDNETGLYLPSTIWMEYFDTEMVHKILNLFVQHHRSLSDEAHDILVSEPVKIKIIKTIADEAAILIYRSHSGVTEDPLCGVYFDIALLSLAPLSIMPRIIN